MPRQPIPERDPVTESVSGSVVQLDGEQALIVNAQTDPAEIIHDGALIVRYGAKFLGKPHLSIVPGLLVMDYGDILTGEEAWSFLLKRSNLHPRAEVVGYRNDGRDDMVFLKVLDLALTPAVLVYADADANTPIANPTALIAPAETDSIPARIVEYLPRYDSVRDWQQALIIEKQQPPTDGEITP